MNVVVRKGQTVEWKRQGRSSSSRSVRRPCDRNAFPGLGGQFKESYGGNRRISFTGTVSESDDLDVVYKYNVEVAGKVTLDPAIIIDK